MKPHVIGFDDAPFDRQHRGDVRVFGAVMTGQTIHAVMSGKVRRDGRNSTAELTRLVNGHERQSKHLQFILLQGIALAGFNVIDIHALARETSLPVLVVSRKQPDLSRIRQALLQHVPGGERKWQLLEAAGPMEAAQGLHIQRAGLSLADAEELLDSSCFSGKVPEVLRVAHLIAGGVTRGHSAGQRV